VKLFDGFAATGGVLAGIVRSGNGGSSNSRGGIAPDDAIEAAFKDSM
jgi:hypothetical protein